MKKFLSMILMSAMILSMLSGCGSKSKVDTQDNTANSTKESDTQSQVSGYDPNKEYTLTYWHFDASDNIVTALEGIIADFKVKYPNITVDYLALPTDSFYQKYLLAVATNTAPDIFGTRDIELLDLVNQDAIIPLDDYIKDWDQKDNIMDSIWQTATSNMPDGKTYIIPSYMNIGCSWYNTKMMDEKNIQIPKTIDEFLEDCEKYANPANNQYFYSLRGGTASYDNLFIFLMSYAGGTGFFNADGTCVLSEDIYAEALDKYAEIYKNGWTSKDSVTNGYKEIVSEFGSGISMSLTHNSSSVTTHKDNLGDGNFVNAIPPAGKSGKTSMPSPSIMGSSVTSQSKNPEVAALFCEFLAEHEEASKYCLEAGKTPVNRLVYEDDWCKNDKYLPLYSQMLEDENITWYSNPIWLSNWNILITEDVLANFQAVLMGEMTSKDALANWADQLTGTQQKYLSEK